MLQPPILLGAAGLGQRGVSAEDVGQRAAAELMDALGSGACCDEWLQDQLVVFMALAKVGGTGGFQFRERGHGARAVPTAAGIPCCFLPAFLKSGIVLVVVSQPA